MVHTFRQKAGRERLVIWASNTGGMRRAALAAAVLALCLPATWSRGQYGRAPSAQPRAAAPRAAQAPRYAAPQPQRVPMQNNRVQSYARQNPRQGSTPSYMVRPAYPGSSAYPNRAYPGQDYPGQVNPGRSYPGIGQPGSSYARPAYPGPGYSGAVRPGYSSPGATPPGHLGDWLNQHRNLPVQDQERMLRSDPNFNSLPGSEQQRVVQQLRQVDQLPEQQRERRLARAEILERMSPQDRMSVNLSAQRWGTLPPNRQTLMKNAFQDLRGVPLEQRQTVLNSNRYQGVFTPEERGILSNVLRAEPYQPAR